MRLIKRAMRKHARAERKRAAAQSKPRRSWYARQIRAYARHAPVRYVYNGLFGAVVGACVGLFAGASEPVPIVKIVRVPASPALVALYRERLPVMPIETVPVTATPLDGNNGFPDGFIAPKSSGKRSGKKG